jgi:Raf kinase inhibitor-like YbhB/YbcL family protein
MTFAVHSSAFAEGGSIPRRYTRDGENVSPPLEWSDAPPGVRSFALICEDPDAPSGTFHHWAICNIGPEQNALPEGVNASTSGWDVAQNDFGNAAYDGPQPPRGHGLHHYHFKVVALDADELDISSNDDIDEFWRAVKPHVIAQAEIVGTYQR